MRHKGLILDNFHQFGFPEALIHRLDQLNFKAPTPVQAQAIPEIISGRDILASAPTGTGKTGAFGIPLAAGLMENPQGAALIVTPTRELAQQVLREVQSMIPKSAKIRTACLIGGEAYGRQINDLKARPRLIVGTPGRINDHLENGKLKLGHVGFLVLDETDRMLDMGFSVQIESIVEALSPERQTVLFSATLPKNIMNLAGKYLNNPARVAVEADNAVAKNIDHKIRRVGAHEKHEILRTELSERDGSVIIFVKTKHGADRMATRITEQGHKAEAIHGDLKQAKRARVIKDFRQEKFRVLVATDVAARGLDIPHIQHVINFDLPQSPEDYIHRIGRTARAGASGEALAMVAPDEVRKWNNIAKLMDPEQMIETKSKSSDKPKSKGPKKFKRKFRDEKDAARHFANKGGSRGGKPRRPRRAA